MPVLSRSRELCQRLGMPPSPPVLRALAIASVTQAEFQQAHDLGDQLLGLVQRHQDPVLLVEAHYVLGVTLFWKGALALSRSHLEQAVAHYDRQRSPTHVALYTQDPEGVCLIRLAIDLWCLGYAEQAQARSREAVARARELAHPFSLAYVLATDAWLQNLRRDVCATREQAEADIVLCREHGIAFWLPLGQILHGWALGEQGEVAAGIGPDGRGNDRVTRRRW